MDALALGKKVDAFVAEWAPKDPSDRKAKFWPALQALLDDTATFAAEKTAKGMTETGLTACRAAYKKGLSDGRQGVES